MRHFLFAFFFLFCTLWKAQRAFAEEEAVVSFRAGVVLALTGQASNWSSMFLKGLRLAQEDLKEEGFDITLIVEDSGTSTSGSVKVFQKLVSVDKTDIVIGNIWSFLNSPLIPLAKRENVLLISPELVDCELGEPFTFHGGTKLDLIDPAYEAYFKLHPEVKSSVVVNFDDPGWGHRQRDAWRRAAKGTGVTEVGHVETADLRPEFKSLFLRLVAEKPDAFFVAHEPILSLKALRQLHYSGEVIQANALYEGLVSGANDGTLFNGVHYADSLPEEEFARKFEEKFGLPPVLEPHVGYEILRSVAYAVKKNPAAPQLALKSLSYKGVSGPIDFRRGCSGNFTPWHLFRVTNGRPELAVRLDQGE